MTKYAVEGVNTPKKTQLVCGQCSGSNVQALAWVDANTNEYKDEGPEGDGTKWCLDCSDPVKLIHKTIEDEDNDIQESIED